MLRKHGHNQNLGCTIIYDDKECMDLKIKVTEIGIKLRTEIDNKVLRNELFATKKILKKTVRKKKRMYQKTILKENAAPAALAPQVNWKNTMSEDG